MTKLEKNDILFRETAAGNCDFFEIVRIGNDEVWLRKLSVRVVETTSKGERIKPMPGIFVGQEFSCHYGSRGIELPDGGAAQVWHGQVVMRNVPSAMMEETPGQKTVSDDKSLDEKQGRLARSTRKKGKRLPQVSFVPDADVIHVPATSGQKVLLSYLAFDKSALLSS